MDYPSLLWSVSFIIVWVLKYHIYHYLIHIESFIIVHGLWFIAVDCFIHHCLGFWYMKYHIYYKYGRKFLYGSFHIFGQAYNCLVGRGISILGLYNVAIWERDISFKSCTDVTPNLKILQWKMPTLGGDTGNQRSTGLNLPWLGGLAFQIMYILHLQEQNEGQGSFPF